MYVVHLIFLLDGVHLKGKDPEVTQRSTKGQVSAKFTNALGGNLNK